MKHWSNYWTTSNTLNSFAESDTSKGYTGAIKDYWFTVFSTLKPESRVVDIGCGNGALACLAVEYSEEHNLNFEVHGIDAAEINPLDALKSEKESLKLLQKVKFHPNTAAEQLPFEPKSVDMFISQFGFEYANLKQALKESKRVLSNNGRVSLMCHHPDSTVSKDCQAGENLLNTILHSSPLFVQVDLLLDIASQVRASGQFKTWQNNTYNQSISRTIKWILDMLKQEFSSQEYSVWLQDLFNRVVPILQSINNQESTILRQQLAQQFKLLDEHRQRLKEQLKATLTQSKIDEAKQYAKSLQLNMKVSSFEIDQEPFAWSLKIK